MLDYIKLNRANNLRVSDIALHFGYNEKYLSHLFRKLSGVPLKQFILKSKMDEANYLLTDTNLSIGEIAVKLGYTDAHNLPAPIRNVPDCHRPHTGNPMRSGCCTMFDKYMILVALQTFSLTLTFC